MWWNDRARELQEMSSDYGISYEKEHLNRIIIHTRQDLILCVSYLDSINEQLSSIKNTLRFIAVLGVAAVLFYLEVLR